MNFIRIARSAAMIAAAAAFAFTAACAGKTKVFADDRTLGNPFAPVTVIEYASPMCPHCARFNAEILPLLKKTYIDTGKVRFVFRVFPLGAPDGAVSAMAACAARKNPRGYFDFIDRAFREQPQWDPDGYDIPDIRAALAELGKRGGIPADKVEACMLDKKEWDRVNRIAEDGAKRYKIEGVPTLVINDQVLEPQDFQWEKLKAHIDGLLPKAKPPHHKAKKKHKP